MKSVEIMVPCAWFPEAVRMLNENPGLDVYYTVNTDIQLVLNAFLIILV